MPRPLRTAGFTLIELLVAFGIFGLICSGLLYGYVQSNRMAEWSAMSLAAQSYAQQGAEQLRAADWRPRDYPYSTGFGTMDELPAPYSRTNCGPAYILDIPIKGDPSASDFAFFVTNYVRITDVSVNPAVRQIRSDAVWKFYVTGVLYTNTAIIMRAPDQ